MMTFASGIRLAMTTLTVALAFAAGPTAHADGYNEEQIYGYIGLLDRYKVTYRSVQAALAMGDQVCSSLHAGVPVANVFWATTDRLGKWPGVSVFNGATSYLCPDTGPAVQEFMNSQPRQYDIG